MHNSDAVKEIIKELINLGIGRAAKSMNEMLNYEIQLSVPDVQILTSDEIRDYLAKADVSNFVHVIQDFSGKLSGRGVISFPIIKGKTLVNTLLETSGKSAKEFDLDEREAILEVGNLVINAVQGVISDAIRQETECQLPKIVFDDCIFPDDMLNENKIFILCETVLAVKGIDIEGSILFIYAYESIGLFVNNFIDTMGEKS